jgi:hypothetical protein
LRECFRLKDLNYVRSVCGEVVRTSSTARLFILGGVMASSAIDEYLAVHGNGEVSKWLKRPQSPF